MTVQLPNCLLGVRAVDPDAVDAHGAPLPSRPRPVGDLLPGKAMELDTGGWQLALDPSLWPVRVGDNVVDDQGRQWRATLVKLLTAPALTPDERVTGIDMDIAFVRVMANQVTPDGTEALSETVTGRDGYLPELEEVGFGSQPFGSSPFGGSQL